MKGQLRLKKPKSLRIMLALLLVATLTSTLTVNPISEASALNSMVTPAFNSQPYKTEPTRGKKGAIGTLSLASTDWNKTYGGEPNDDAHALVQTSDGGYALAGTTGSFGAGNSDFWLVKTDSSGNAQWNKTYGGTSGESAHALVQTSDGGFALAGYTHSFGAGQDDFWLVKTNASGTMQWSKTYGGTFDDAAYALVQTSDGGYALAGTTGSFGAGNSDFWLVKTDSAGNHQWNKTYGGTNYDEARALVQTADGGYALAGTENSYGAGGYDSWLVKTDSVGNALWNMTYGGTGGESAYALMQTGDGGYALAGGADSFGAGGSDFWLVKTDSSGNAQWNKTYGGTNTELAYALVRTSDGGYALAGFTNSFGAGGGDFWLVKTDVNGNEQWNKAYGGTNLDWAYALVQTMDGGYALAGATLSSGAGNGDFWLVKFTPTSIYIRADGSVDPVTAPIQRNGDLYMLTDDIYTSVDGIYVYRNNMTLDGRGYLLQGSGDPYYVGLDLSFVSNVTVKNMVIKAFDDGIYMENSTKNVIVGNRIENTGPNDGSIVLCAASLNTIAGNNLTSNKVGIWLDTSPENTLVGNRIVNSLSRGIILSGSDNNYLSENVVMASNDTGIYVGSCSNNVLAGNNITNNIIGIRISSCGAGNLIYHNNLVNNLNGQAYSSEATSMWDEGYPSGGNYWSDYNGTDLYRGPGQNENGSDGIGDQHYVMDVDNQDNYPLMQPWAGNYPTRYSWPMFQHDSAHMGYTESPAPDTNRIRWQYTANVSSMYGSSPAVVDGRVYFTSNQSNQTSICQAVTCIDAVTGSLLWNCSIANVTSSPSVADGRLYVGSESSLHCLDATTGSQLWNYYVPYLACSVGYPVVAGGKVYFKMCYFTGNYNYIFNCIDAVTGEKLWNHTFSYSFSSPAVVGNRVYFGSDDQNVYCLDAFTGLKLWNYTTGSNVRSSPTVADGRVYIGSGDHNVYCFDAFTGLKLWNYTTGSWVDSSPAVAYGMVFIGSLDRHCYALNATTGMQIWNYTVYNGGDSSPAVADGKVYYGSTDNRVYCLNASTGSKIWQYITGNAVFCSPAIADGMVIIGSADHVLYAFGGVIRVPEDYKTLQGAVDAANPGDTILVAPGVYHESIIINKAITLIGKPGSEPIFSGGGSGIAITLLPDASGSTIAGIVITSWDQGILMIDSSDCKIYNNIMSLINYDGIALKGSNADGNQIYSNIFNENKIAVNLTGSSTSNSVYNNVVSLNDVGLEIESSGNVIYANIIAENNVGIKVSYSNNVIYHNNFIDNNFSISLSMPTSNAWDDGYPSGGNFWAGKTGADDYGGPLQNIVGSDGIFDTNYTVAINNVDNYPLLHPFNPHNIGIMSFAKAKTVVCRSFILFSESKILNHGLYDETFIFTICANTTMLMGQLLTVMRRNCTTFAFAWNTSGFALGNYTLCAFAEPVQGEADVGDNSFTCGWVIVSIIGDVTSQNGWPDGKVDMRDIGVVARRFGTFPGGPLWDPNYDINDDGKIDMKDIGLTARHFGESAP